MFTRKKAAAIQYIAGKDRSPRVIAKGRGYVAEKIIEAAEKNGVPIQNNPALANALEALDVNTEIPAELYRAVAEVLVFVYKLNGKAGQLRSSAKK